MTGRNRKKVFLGGTCNKSTWRERLIPMLEIDYFNPIVEDWTEECQAEEIRQREECDFCLYVITPRMTGVYSIAEVVDDSNKRPKKTELVVLRTDDDMRFSDAQWKSLLAVAKMVTSNGGRFHRSLNYVAAYLNSQTGRYCVPLVGSIPPRPKR